jgi:putative transposase
VIRRCGPWKRFDEVEYAILDWVLWFNGDRLLEPIGCMPPAEFAKAHF